MGLPDEFRNAESSTASFGSDSVKPEIESSAPRQTSPPDRHFPGSYPVRRPERTRGSAPTRQGMSNFFVIRFDALRFVSSGWSFASIFSSLT